MLAWACAAAASVYAVGCGSNRDSTFGKGSGNGSGNGNGNGSGGSNGNVFGDAGGLGSGSDGGGSGTTGGLPQQVCNDAGVCSCPNGNTTTITGYVYDPAGKNPLYNVSVYIPDPASPLPNLDTVPIACGCSQLFPASVLATGYPTDANGFFTIPCAPSGMVSLVAQTGKWRMRFDGINVTPNSMNKVPNLRLPRNSSEGSLPNIAIATGGADSLECLPLRIGVDASEYVAGPATGGHMHIYQGDGGATTNPAAPVASQALWNSQANLNAHDVVLLSCEGHETTDGAGGRGGGGVPLSAAHQQFLMTYANSGGRVFASHFHYAWFSSGPFNTAPNQLANWTTGTQTVDDTMGFPADIDGTLFNGAAFPEGIALNQWLGNVQALDANGKLDIFFSRDNVHAGALLQPPSTEWIKLDSSVTAGMPPAANATQYFSVDMPIGATSEALCGRVVYSDLHVSGGPGAQFPAPLDTVTPDYMGAGMNQGGTVPAQCAVRDLVPQEKALEFMLFDLSSCLVPIGQTTMLPPVKPPK
jgi:hypothetical protein